MSVKKLSKLSASKMSQKTTGPVGVVGPDIDMRWKAEEAMRTIHRAEEFKRNKPLLREVKKLAKAHAKACGVK